MRSYITVRFNAVTRARYTSQAESLEGPLAPVRVSSSTRGNSEAILVTLGARKVVGGRETEREIARHEWEGKKKR
jgi:hypothetical protein